jgi:hypothetical protein
MPDRTFATSFSFVLTNGVEVWPVKIQNRATGDVTFLVSRHGNTRDDAEQVDDQEELARRVAEHRRGAECRRPTAVEPL